MDWVTASSGDKRIREIIFHLLGLDERLMEFVFDPIEPRLRKRAGLLKEDAWSLSHGEQILIRTALEFWSGSGHVFLWELLETLDDENLRKVLKAIEEIRDLREDVGVNHVTP